MIGLTEADHVVGLIFERDYSRKIVLNGKFSKDVPVGEFMSVDIIGIVSIGDIVKTIIRHKEEIIAQLED